MSRHNELGRLGEDKAVLYLEEKGYKILQRNYRFGRAEVDIIAKLGDTIVFLEVKTRSSYVFGFPEESVGATKRKMMAKAATAYFHETESNSALRFDIIAVFKSQDDKWFFKHFEDAFFFYE